MAMLRKAKARVSESAMAATATPANPEKEDSELDVAKAATPATPEMDTGPRSRRVSSRNQGVSENTTTYPVLTDRTKARLKQVVFSLTRDCIDWYQDDQDGLNDMSEEKLEEVVLNYLSLRNFYRHREPHNGAEVHDR